MGKLIVVIAVGASLSAGLLAALAAVPARSASPEPQAALPAAEAKPAPACASVAWPYRPGHCPHVGDASAAGVAGERAPSRQVRVISLDRRGGENHAPAQPSAAPAAPKRQ